MKALDAIAAIAVGVYLVAVAVNGNSAALIAQAEKDKAFLKWAVAVAIAFYAMKAPGMAEPVSLIIMAAFFALFVSNGTKITEQAQAFWNSL
jgi:chromate transport protein ChrA